MKRWARSGSMYLLLLLFALVIYWFMSAGQNATDKLPYNGFLTKVESGEIKELSIEGGKITGKYKNDSKFETFIPPLLMDSAGKLINDKAAEGELAVTGKQKAKPNFFIELLPMLLMFGLFIGVIYLFMGGAQGGGSKAMNFGKNRAKMARFTGQRLTFSDVAGLKEEKEELEELVDFLKNPRRYRSLGARIPKGVLLVGPPGTGKTYLSRATAGEAGVPFFTISGSDFVEMFVGVGASRVRDLFDEAKKNGPCIVFIDEIDAVGRKRGAGMGGGHDEREQTLNQLLVEMDGFTDNVGVIIMAATNRPDILDPALLRAGRFDRQVSVGLPDVREREEIIKVHARNKPLASDIDFEDIAKHTTGFTPADLENIMNESALLAARDKDRAIRMDIVKRSITKVIAGIAKHSRVVTEEERKLTAYHEAGHAVLARLLPGADPVHQVTIIPRGRAGGFTLTLPEHDKSYVSKKNMEDQIVMLLGGRVAEQITLGDISTGASNDLSRVTKVARAMVTQYAMSDNLGAMSYDSGGEVFMGRDFGTSKEYSEEVAATIDREIRAIVDKAYNRATKMLEENKDKVLLVGNALLKYETISKEEFETVFDEGMEALDKLIEENKKKTAEDRERLEKEYAEKQLREAEENRKLQKQIIDALESEQQNQDGFGKDDSGNDSDNPFLKG